MRKKQQQRLNIVVSSMRFDFNDFCTPASHYTTSSLSLDCLPGKHPSTLVKYNFTKQNHRTQDTNTLSKPSRADMSKSMFSVVFALSHQFEYVILRLGPAPRRVSFRVGWLALLYFCAWAHHHHNSFYFIFYFFANRSQELNRTCRMLERGAAAL